jgi:MFS family permease
VAGDQAQLKPPTAGVARGGRATMVLLAGQFAVYRRLFEAPGAKGFVAAGFLARLTTSMIGLGLVLALTAGNHRYALAGAVVAVLVLANAMAFPVAGRYADRRGQHWLLARLTVCFSVAMVALMATVAGHGPVWRLFLLGFAAGATMPVAHPLVRARWTALYGGSERLRAAYGFETATTEVVFIVGPILVTLLATAVVPLAGLVVALAFAVAGALGLAVQRSSQPVPTGTVAGRTASALRQPALRTLCLAQVAIGGVFGSVEIVTAAFASAHHARGLTGVLLGLWGLTSAVTGLAYGAVRVRAGLHRRLLIAIILFTCGFVPLLEARSMAELTVFLVVAGLAMAPATITVFEVIQRVVPAGSLTEAVSWAGSGVVLGMTAGTLAGGWAAEHLGIHRMYAVPVAYATLALAVIVARYPRLRAQCQAAISADG